MLLKSGNAILAETCKRDSNWGIGITMDDERAKKPWMWAETGNNILGWSIMCARDRIIAEM